MKPQYQLTRHPVGSIREVLTLAWPIAVSLFSLSLMMFVDRLYLAHYSTAALTGAANAGMASWTISIFSVMLGEITEVFVGRHHGAGELRATARPCWQMIWLSVMSIPVYLAAGPLLAPWFFSGHFNAAQETGYFITITAGMPFPLISIALMGFFTGVGQVRIVGIAALIGNIVNIALDYPFIFGWGAIPPMGAMGAALATVISQALGMVLLFAFFFRKTIREKYHTLDCKLDISYLKEMIRIGGPNGLNRFLELLAHFVFMQIMIGAGPDRITVASIIQSIMYLLSFIGDSLSKAVSTVVSNLIGGQRADLTDKVLRSSLVVHTFFFAILVFVVASGGDRIAWLYLPANDPVLISFPHIITDVKAAMTWLLIFFLFDGFSLILMGMLTAGGDTKFILYAGIALHWLFYVLPVYIFVGVFGGTGDKGWLVLAIYSVICFGTYFFRYRKRSWTHALAPTPA